MRYIVPEKNINIYAKLVFAFVDTKSSLSGLLTFTPPEAAPSGLFLRI